MEARARAAEAQEREKEAHIYQQALSQAAKNSGSEVEGLQARLDATEGAREALQVREKVVTQ